MRICILILALGIAGCAAEPRLDQRSRAADPACADVAAARMRDAMINGADSKMQQAIWNDAYKNCVFWKNKSGFVER